MIVIEWQSTTLVAVVPMVACRCSTHCDRWFVGLSCAKRNCVRLVCIRGLARFGFVLVSDGCFDAQSATRAVCCLPGRFGGSGLSLSLLLSLSEI